MSRAQDRHREGIEGVHKVPHLLSGEELAAIGKADADYVLLEDNKKYQEADEATRAAMRHAQHQRRKRYLAAMFGQD